ncbi:hypothetical protein BDV96DRAFT_645853 [Lophiotrema nucula]|uniref:Protein kinase domain-containing protein n=1 Tax=Lophiotrema nucula TaxID=690887 RepID=A0A6A5ZB40_9PLEO|nr:hypothetical protein BDV96DRAFT_645853 [Lophiotrema nucula]
METELRPEVIDLKRQIDGHRIEGAYGSFVPHSAVITILTEHRTEQLLIALKEDPQLSSEIRNHNLRVFLILCLVNQHVYIRRFLHEDFLSDSRLPFLKTDKGKWDHDCKRFFDKFYEAQWQFCARKLESKRLNRLNFYNHEILPITKRERLRKGVNSSTYRIEVEHEYNGLSSNTDTFVMKTCSATDEKQHVTEVAAYGLLLQQKDLADHIVQFYGSFIYRGQFNILLEHVDGGTLEHMYQYLRPPESGEEILNFWTSFTKIIRPLMRIHALKHPTSKTKLLQGIHQDIKPANILISRTNDPSEYHLKFKLADFAFTKFQTKPAAGQDLEDEDERGTQTYSAPEICRFDQFLKHSKGFVDPSVDIWSLGGVLSETLVWSVLGKAGLNSYRNDRIEATKNFAELEKGGYEECFHDGENVLGVVHRWHMRARERARNHDYILDGMIDYAESMLEIVSARPKAETIYRSFERSLKRAREQIFPNGTPQASREQLPGNRIPGVFQTRKTRPPPPEIPAGPPPDDIPAIDARTEPSPQTPLSYEDEKVVIRVQSPAIPKNRELGHRRRQGSSHILSDTAQAGPSSTRARGKEVTFRSTTESIRPQKPSESEYDQRDFAIETSNSREKFEDRPPHVSAAETLQWIAETKRAKTANSRPYYQIPSPAPLPGYEYFRRLRNRDQIFLFDDSKSMTDHWQDVISTFKAIGYIAKAADPDKMEAFFTNSHTTKRSKDREDFVQMLTSATPGGTCSMHSSISKILTTWWNENKWCFETEPEKKRRSLSSMFSTRNKKEGLNLYVFTNGVWQPKPEPLCGVDEVIKGIVDKMIASESLTERIGIQFISFGNNPTGIRRLKMLDSGLRQLGIEKDIVDTEPSSGNIWKMLLGSIDPWWDDDDPPDHEFFSLSDAD